MGDWEGELSTEGLGLGRANLTRLGGRRGGGGGVVGGETEIVVDSGTGNLVGSSCGSSSKKL